MSAATGNTEKPVTAKSSPRAAKQSRAASVSPSVSPSDSAAMPPPPPRPSREQIFLMNQDLDGGPTPRDLSIHTAVTDEGLSQRQVAVKYGISQARVSQIVKAVDEWSLRVADDRFADYTPQQRRRLAENTFRERLNYFYSLSLGAWRSSQQGETIDRTGGLDSGSVTRSAFGKVCYIDLAMRIAERIAELDWSDVRSKRREAEGDGEREGKGKGEGEGEGEGEEPAETAVAEQEAALPETSAAPDSPAAPQEGEKRLSPAAVSGTELDKKPAVQRQNSSGVTKNAAAASRPAKARSERPEPLITPYEPRHQDPEREALYRGLETLFAGLG